MPHHPRRSARALALAALLATVAACGGDDATGSSNAPVATEVRVTPSVDTLDGVGASATLAAVVLDQRGEVMPGASVNWSVATEGIVSVDQVTGTATAVQSGEGSVAAHSGAAVGSARLTVLGPVDVLITSASTQFAETGYEQLTAELQNRGATGAFRIEVWGPPTDAGGADRFFGSSNAATLGPLESRTVSYRVQTGTSGTPRIGWLIMYNKPRGAPQYVEMSRFQLP